MLCLLTVPVPELAMAAAGSTTTESDSPINDQGSSYHYRSNVKAVTPAVPGLSVQVLEFADRLLLVNHTHKTVTIYGYEGEPYARVLADGTAEQNANAPATYLNTSFYGDVNPPPNAKPTATPRWEVVDRTGQFEWHDHRIHYMSPTVPPEVKDQSRRTLVFNWRVPIQVGTTRAAIDGSLYWTPENSKAPIVVIVLGVAIALGGLALVVVVRRRRAGQAGGERPGAGPPAREAW
ncbi:MAG TPA: hypothetical protein VGG08_01075 [Solirubrobacteraceae bacterium]